MSLQYQKALQILGLSGHPNPSQIKKAYRKLALRYHPDRNPNKLEFEERFLECTEAYNFLIEHVQDLRAVPEDAGIGSPVTSRQQRAREGGSSVFVENTADIFDDIFGFSQNGRVLGYQDPQDLYLSIKELAFGAVKKNKLYAYEKCLSCFGSGALPNTHATICTHCFGLGKIKTGLENYHTPKMCPKCKGRGRYAKHPCADCDGYGRRRKACLQKIAIPPGLRPDQSYTLSSQDVRTGKGYELFVHIHLKSDLFFRVENSQIVCEYPVSQKLAQQGGVVEIPSLWGWVKLSVSQQSQDGDIVVLKDCGLQDSKRQSKDDMQVLLRVVPEKQAKRGAKLFLQEMVLNNPAFGSPQRSLFRKFLLWIRSL